MYTSYNKMLGQLQHPHSCTGKFRKILTIGTIFLHHQSKTLTYQILLFLPLTDWWWEQKWTDRKTDIYLLLLFTSLKVCIWEAPHLWWQECPLYCGECDKRGLSSVMERTRTISPELFIRRGNVELWHDVCHLTAPVTMSNPNKPNHLLRFTR